MAFTLGSSKRTDLVLSIAGGLLIPILLFALTPKWTSLFKERKLLEYQVLTQSHIGDLSFSAKDWPDVAIVYKGQPVANGTFLSIRIANTGTVPIQPSDFERPILLKVDRSNIIIAFRKAFMSPSDLNVVAAVLDSSLQIQPLLMNPGDEFILELFGRDTFRVTGLAAHIAGVRFVQKAEERNRSGFYMVWSQDQGLGHSIVSLLLPTPRPLVIAMAIGGFLLLGFSVSHLVRSTQVAMRVVFAVILSYALVASVFCVSIIALTLRTGLPRLIEAGFVGLLAGALMYVGTYLSRHVAIAESEAPTQRS